MNTDTIKSMLEEFEAAAQAVQTSLLSRNADQIWNALAQQEEAVSKLSGLRGLSREGVDLSTQDSGLQRMMDRCKSVLQANRALSSRFLEVVDQTLSQLGGQRKATYSMGMNAPRRSAPLLVCQQG